MLEIAMVLRALRWSRAEKEPVRTPVAPGEIPALAAAASDRPPVHGVLIGLDGPLAGTVHAVRDREQVVGRTAGCEIRLDSVYVSRAHLRLRAGSEGVRAEPLSPTNPVLVNGRVIPDGGHALSDGDVLEIGGTRFSYRTAVPSAREQPG